MYKNSKKMERKKGINKMPIRDDLGTRMKVFYENIPKTRLMRRTPVAIRLQGISYLYEGFPKTIRLCANGCDAKDNEIFM